MSGSSHNKDCSSASSKEEDINDNSSGTSESEGDALVDSNKGRFRQKATTGGACSPACSDLKSTPKVHHGRTPADTGSVSLDAGNDDILDGIWPGSHDIQLVTHFVMTHFARDWTAYLHFAQWSDPRVLTDPGTTICLDDWLQTKSGKEDGLREDTVGETWYC